MGAGGGQIQKVRIVGSPNGGRPKGKGEGAFPRRVRSGGSKPTLAKPTLTKVKVLVVCKDFGFGELIVWVF